MKLVKIVPTCEHKPDEFLVYYGEEVTGDPLMVLGYPDGTISNRWSDGTVGLPEAVREGAEQSEDWHCTECGAECDFEDLYLLNAAISAEQWMVDDMTEEQAMEHQFNGCDGTCCVLCELREAIAKAKVELL